MKMSILLIWHSRYNSADFVGLQALSYVLILSFGVPLCDIALESWCYISFDCFCVSLCLFIECGVLHPACLSSESVYPQEGFSCWMVSGL